ncbi:hypothetical protein HYT25_03775 [Candidatus Pacearchaeota archaeon]|nr:hypothetical protein [Candidatus Pacearchaeota archaeon]
MNFVKKIFDGKIDNDVHMQFQKYSRGEFRNKAEIHGKQSKGKFTINTSADFANDLVKDMAGKLGNEKTNVTGAIISTSDLNGRIKFKSKKQFQGVKNYAIDEEMSGNEILKLLEEFPKTFFALSFSTKDSILKIKPKAPKSGKPGKETEERKKPDFCKLTTTDRSLGSEFIFEKPDFKEAWISHTYFIEEIKIPDELKNERDFAIVREKSLRKGRIVRTAKIDGKEMREEREFEA